MKHGSKLTPKGAKIVAALERFFDTIEAGIPIEQRGDPGCSGALAGSPA
jgi:hypothetical protein